MDKHLTDLENQEHKGFMSGTGQKQDAANKNSEQDEENFHQPLKGPEEIQQLLGQHDGKLTSGQDDRPPQSQEGESAPLKVNKDLDQRYGHRMDEGAPDQRRRVDEGACEHGNEGQQMDQEGAPEKNTNDERHKDGRDEEDNRRYGDDISIQADRHMQDDADQRESRQN
ncbi:hypothetical protein [Neobacillus jeddahensis]|uniref:hypothetical protein n=1 Tax=Neobacillus jeddahensis TaxID=1461580 RepID=UPI00058B70F2|nr:hypothetical protein [Neobacillus jeddahensis]